MRESRCRMLAMLIHRLGDFSLAEDALQDAGLSALERWGLDGVPQHPRRWLLIAAQRKAIDRLRRMHTVQRKQQDLLDRLDVNTHDLSAGEDGDIGDERLRLIFTCCHPALEFHLRVSLTLQVVCGFSIARVADSFLVSEAAMAQRLARAKKKIAAAGIAYRVPEAAQLDARLDAVLAVIYLIFNQGYCAAGNAKLMSKEFTHEAMHLAHTLNALLPGEAEVLGLLALMHFLLARYRARSDAGGALVDLVAQDRALWDRELIARGEDFFAQAVALKKTGPQQIQAAISAVHCAAADFAATDWPQIALLYDKLLEHTPSPTVRLNRAVALCFCDCPTQALQALDALAGEAGVKEWPGYHNARAEALKRLRRHKESAASLMRAIELSKHPMEQAHLQRLMHALPL